MTLLEAIYRELVKSNRPLTDIELEQKLRTQSRFKDKSPNFVTSIRARIYEKAKLEQYPDIVVLAPNTFGLASWVNEGRYQIHQTGEKEHHKGHLDEVIAVIPKEYLSKLIKKDGFKQIALPINWISNYCTPMVRRDAEQSYDHIQLISSFLITCSNEVLTHVRSGNAPETRLKGEKSILLGGHIAYSEVGGFVAGINYELFEQPKLLERELHEEVDILSAHETIYRGCLYDSSRDVSSQHLSLVHHVELSNKTLTIKEKGYHRCPEWCHVNELVNNINDYENWSVEIINNINKVLLKND
ncbi:hypothetical protein ACEV8K_19965 [Vibrio parahaemolyticus]|uniref:hypothetical protein n=1 Tax=Vibrio alginolyticus TaxID=663 RepID=UPI00215CE407|nr:hypothetical protein [Vibrio alginolyticus]MBE4186430.1 hypothetical protein [Vibrio parahaemolyticus]MCR9315699.1 hypothetical protein [Vibrio alginolyticus]MCR9316525.1 hypothetical protein [Vibrio alginolyticus]MCR9402274.1 hypothetical protein [Vibrio alginolyticus]MCR9465946.1 hypothetical protein [Vibrio alginolyticus]